MASNIDTVEQWIAAAKAEVEEYEADARLHTHTDDPKFQVVDGEGLPLGGREATEKEAWESAASVCGVITDLQDLAPEEQDLVIGHAYNGKLTPVCPPSAEYLAGFKTFMGEDGDLDCEVLQ